MSRDPDYAPFWGDCFVIHKLGLAMVKLAISHVQFLSLQLTKI